MAMSSACDAERAESLRFATMEPDESFTFLSDGRDNLDAVLVEDTPPKHWHHALRKHHDHIAFAMCIALGILVWVIPPPQGLSSSGMHLLAVFISVVLALMNSTYPISLVVSLALIVLTLTQTFKCETQDGLSVECWKCGTLVENQPFMNLTNMIFTGTSNTNGPSSVYQCKAFRDGFKVAISGFGEPIVWLITCAFHIGTAIQSTKLGSRIALMLIHVWGKSLLGLGYAIFAAECVLAPFVPSNTARGGGIILPIVKSMTDLLGSSPTHNPELGRFLIFCGAHGNLLISSLFITGAAPNPIVADAIERLFPDISFGFFEWTAGAIVPVSCAAVILPWLFCKIEKPEYDGEFTRVQARAQLQDLGSMSRKEIQLCAILLVALMLWMSGPVSGLPEALVAFMALMACLFLDITSWKDVVSNDKAWDTFFWLSCMLVMAEQLSALGVSKWIGITCANLIYSMNTHVIIGGMFLASAYFLSSIFFSSITGHAVALISPFLEAAHAIGCPPMFIIPILAYFSSLCASLTTFSTGTIVLYFSQGFTTQRRWCCVGITVAALYFCIYFSIGIMWWELIW